MKLLLQALIFLFPACALAEAFDCSTHKPFPPKEFRSVKIEVARIFWRKGEQGPEEVDEAVCSTVEAMPLPVLDIRGREKEWYYCNDQGVQLECNTTFRDKPAVIMVNPGVVIRDWYGSPARDSYFHARIYPESKQELYHDIFARTLSRNLEKAETFLIGSGGGRGQESGTDTFYVKVELQ